MGQRGYPHGVRKPSLGHPRKICRSEIVSGDIDVCIIDIDATVEVYEYVSATPVPASPAPAPERTYGYGRQPSERACGNLGLPVRVIDEGLIIRPPPIPVNHQWIIVRHIDFIGIYRLNLNIVLNDYDFLLREPVL